MLFISAHCSELLESRFERLRGSTASFRAVIAALDAETVLLATTVCGQIGTQLAHERCPPNCSKDGTVCT